MYGIGVFKYDLFRKNSAKNMDFFINATFYHKTLFRFFI